MSRFAAATTIKLAPRELWGAARYLATQILPYLAKGVYGLREHAVEGFAVRGTFPIGVTDRGVVIWDPAFWNRLPPLCLACAILHESGHWLQRHGKRRGDRDQSNWNDCCDAELNDDLKTAIENFIRRKTDEKKVQEFIDKWLYPATFGFPDGKLAEVYYAMLPRDVGGGEGGGTCCGSGAGNPHPMETDPEVQRAIGELSHTDFECEVIRHQVALDIKAHFENRPPRIGSEKGGWARWADAELKPPKLRWQDKAARQIRTIITTVLGNIDTTYSYPSRRQACVGTGPGCSVLPAFVSPVPEIDLVVDASGSMGQAQFVFSFSEITAILRTLHTANFRFHSVDTTVHVSIPIRNIRDALRTKLPGGGGTDFRSLFEMLTARRPRPDLVIVFTDGFATVPDDAPPYPVIFVRVGKYTAKLPWGTDLEVPYEEKASHP